MPAIVTSLAAAASRGAGISGLGGPAAAGSKKMLSLAEQSFKFTKQNAAAASKTAGISFTIGSLLKQSQIFTGVVGSVFQIIGAFIDIMLLPLIPIVTPIIKTMGKLLGTSAQYMSKKPTELAMQVFKIIPIIGGVISAIEVVNWLKNWLSGPDSPIIKIKNSVMGFFEQFPLNVDKLWTQIKLWGVTKVLEFLTKIDDTWNAITAWLGAIEWGIPKLGNFTPFKGVSSLESPVAALIDALTPIQENLNVELQKINSSLDKVITVDGVKIRGEFAYERADQMARAKGGEDIYTGYNTGNHHTDEENRMLLGL